MRKIRTMESAYQEFDPIVGHFTETPTHSLTTAGSTTKYTKNGDSIITYRPSQPSINSRLARLCRELPVAILPH